MEIGNKFVQQQAEMPSAPPHGIWLHDAYWLSILRVRQQLELSGQQTPANMPALQRLLLLYRPDSISISPPTPQQKHLQHLNAPDHFLHFISSDQ